eukprot:224936-Hanusia_phi.AAC.1
MREDLRCGSTTLLERSQHSHLSRSMQYESPWQVGLAAAIDYALSLGIADIWSRIDMLSSCLRQGLKEIDKVT